jgi:uncharacterized protein (UPF0332 family)
MNVMGGLILMSTGSSSFDWGEYIDLAKKIVPKSIEVSEEACSRVAISRSYYGAFCLARNHAVQKDKVIIPSSSKAHAAVQKHFKTSADNRYKKIGNALERLRLDRNKADYDNILINADKLVQKSIARAEEIQTIIIEVNTPKVQGAGN